MVHRRFLALLLLLPASALCRFPTAFLSHTSRQKRLLATGCIQPSSQAPITQLRAGSIVPVTAKATSAFLGINGLLLLTKPNALLESVYQIPNDGDSKELNTYILRTLGALGLGVSIQVYASIIAKDILPRTAMGLGLVPRAVFFFYTIVSGQMRHLNIQPRFFTINTILTCWCTVSLLFGLGDPTKTGRVYSAMCLLKSLFFVFTPSKVSAKLLGETCEGKSLALMRGLGNELMTSAFLMVTSAWGAKWMTPAAAAGYTCLLWLVLLVDMAFLDKTWRLMDADGPQAQLVHMAITVLFGAGFLLST